jgi:uridine kinase
MELKADEVLVVDSIFASHPTLRAAAEGRPSLDVYLDAPAVVRLVRRLARDKVARGKPVLDNLRGWARILADEKAYIKPLAADADLVLNLVGAEELAGLKAAYAKLLAEEGDPAVARLMADMIRASLEADGAVPSR